MSERMKKQRWFVYSLLLCLLTGRPASARVIVVFEDMVKEADVIVVAKVSEVNVIGGAHVALAEVCQSVRGLKRGSRFAFFAEPTWRCDTTKAVSGETVLLFLHRWSKSDWEITALDPSMFTPDARFEEARKAQMPDPPFYRPMCDGRGRMTFITVKGTTYIEKSILIEWPDFMKSQKFPHPKSPTFMVDLMPLSDMIKAIDRITRAKETKPAQAK